jgi:hypothetical protein
MQSSPLHPALVVGGGGWQAGCREPGKQDIGVAGPVGRTIGSGVDAAVGVRVSGGSEHSGSVEPGGQDATVGNGKTGPTSPLDPESDPAVGAIVTGAATGRAAVPVVAAVRAMVPVAGTDRADAVAPAAQSSTTPTTIVQTARRPGHDHRRRPWSVASGRPFGGVSIRRGVAAGDLDEDGAADPASDCDDDDALGSADNRVEDAALGGGEVR